MEAAREADRAIVAALRADLDAERAAREADQRELAALRARLTEAGAAEGGLLDRVAELDRRAAGLADEVELQRRAREQAEAAAATRAPGEESSRVVADLDAAASALRERAANGTAEAPATEAPVVEPEAAPADEVVAEPAVAPADEVVPSRRSRLPKRPWSSPKFPPRRLPSGSGGRSCRLRPLPRGRTPPAARSASTRHSAARW